MVIVEFARFRDGVVPVRLANVVQGSIMVIRAGIPSSRGGEHGQ